MGSHLMGSEDADEYLIVNLERAAGRLCLGGQLYILIQLRYSSVAVSQKFLKKNTKHCLSKQLLINLYQAAIRAKEIVC